jgi:tripartite ATP-independent transporter DctP family solute receptor
MSKSVMKLATAVAVAALCAIGATAATAQTKIKLGQALPQQHPQGVATDKFAELVKQYTKDRIQVTVYHGGMLGGDDKMLQAVQSGTQDMYYGSLSAVAGKVPAVQIFDLPFLFNDVKEVERVFFSPYGQKLHDRLVSSIGMVGLAWGQAGFRELTNSKRPINKAEDIAGLKIRVMQNQVALDTWKTLGANALPMTITEVFTGLETGALDGQENPYLLIHANKYYEVQKYGTTTNHVYTPCSLVISKRTWDKLGAEDQAAIRKAADESMRYLFKLVDDANKDVVAKLEAGGMKVNALPDAELAKLRDKVRPIVDKYAPVIGADLVKEFMDEIAKARKAN